jgi:hypothetical protein
MVNVPERRVSDASDRRGIYRGGRRATDHTAAKPSPAILCPSCRTGIMTVSAVAYRVGMHTTSYQCPKCGHLEERVSKNE